MKRFILSFVAISATTCYFSQNTWTGSSVSTTTAGDVNISGVLNANGGITTLGIGANSLIMPNTTSYINMSSTLGTGFKIYAETNDNYTNGIGNVMTSTSTGTQYGIKNQLSFSGATGPKYGFYNNVTATTASPAYGIYNLLGGTTTGSSRYGIYNRLLSTGTETKYGIFTQVQNTGANNSSTDATAYGIYAQATGANTRAGYFRGDLEVNQGNTIYSAVNGSKTLFLANYGANDYAMTIALNQTNNAYDWSFNRALVLNRAGELIKSIDNNATKAIVVRNTTLSTTTNDVFRVYGDGKVFATEVNVMLASSFPDYVFQPEYRLLPLNEVKNYIQTNGHLPNIPDAQTVANEGINVGQMTTVLVEKVEELTLYLLQQQTAMEQQQKEIEALKAKLASIGQ